MVLTNRYSQHARRSLAQARLLAQDYQHEAIDTDHLLVGILHEKGSLGYQVLADLNVDMQRAQLEVRVLHAVTDLLSRPLNLTGALRRVLSLSAEESHWFGHHYIGTEHLLLALARSHDGSALSLLRILGITPDQIRRRVRLLLNEGVTEISIEDAKRTARLSELSRRVLNAAWQLAGAEAVAGLEHLLLVLVRERRSPASQLLREHGLDPAVLEAALARRSNFLEQEDSLEDVIDQAVNRADQLGTHYTGTDHILLALAQHRHGARLLRQYGVQPDALIEAVTRQLSR